MRGVRLLGFVLLLVLPACGRTSLVRPRAQDAGHAGGTPGDAAGASDAGVGGSGGRPGSGGAGGSPVGTGGLVGLGGVVATGGGAGRGGRMAGALGGRAATGGAGGAVGAGGAGGAGGGAGAGGIGAAVAGGAVGGRAGAGGTALSGGRIGAGGRPAAGGVAAGGATALDGGAGSSGTCGNGIVDPGEECDLGAGNRDAPAFLVTQADRRFWAAPLVREVSAADFYDYRSSSAHTGLEALATGRILLHLHRPTLALSLIFFHGVDEDSTGQKQGTAKVDLKFSGLPDTTSVAVADEADELQMTSATTATGFWVLTNNTDGGALSGLPFPGDWRIAIDPTFAEGISVWTWVQGDISLVDLDLGQPLAIEAHSSSSQCRTDCTIPRCGDGILDGGEICDPGVPTGYYCTDDCRSFY